MNPTLAGAFAGLAMFGGFVGGWYAHDHRHPCSPPATMPVSAVELTVERLPEGMTGYVPYEAITVANKTLIATLDAHYKVSLSQKNGQPPVKISRSSCGDFSAEVFGKHVWKPACPWPWNLPLRSVTLVGDCCKDCKAPAPSCKCSKKCDCGSVCKCSDGCVKCNRHCKCKLKKPKPDDWNCPNHCCFQCQCKKPGDCGLPTCRCKAPKMPPADPCCPCKPKCKDPCQHEPPAINGTDT